MYPKEDVAIGAEVLRVEHLRFRSRFSADKDIIEDVSFGVRSGEILGLGGLVGAGRSELVNALFGSYRRKAGQILHRRGKGRDPQPRPTPSGTASVC